MTEEKSTIPDYPYSPYAIVDELPLVIFVLALISIISAFIYNGGVITITTGISAALIYVGKYLVERLIDIRLAIENQPIPYEVEWAVEYQKMQAKRTEKDLADHNNQNPKSV